MAVAQAQLGRAQDLRVEASRGAHDVKSRDRGRPLERFETPGRGTHDEEGPIEVRELAERHDRIDPPTEGDQHPRGVEVGFVGVRGTAAVDADVLERKIVAKGELPEAVVQGGVKEREPLVAHRGLGQIDVARRARLVVRQSRQQVPQFADPDEGGSTQRGHAVERDLLAEVPTVEFVVSGEGVVADLEARVAKHVGADHGVSRCTEEW